MNRPVIRSYDQFQQYLADNPNVSETDQVEVVFVIGVDCGICGKLTVMEKTDDPAQADGTETFKLVGNGMLLADDADVFLQRHWDECHPGIPMTLVEDGQTRRAERAPRG